MTRTIRFVGGPKHGQRMQYQHGNVVRFAPVVPLPDLLARTDAAPAVEQVRWIEYRQSNLNHDLFLFEGNGGERIDEHYCKWCETTWAADAPAKYTGDAMLECPRCKHIHYRQFELGVAVGCNSPTTRRPRRIKALEIIR